MRFPFQKDPPRIYLGRLAVVPRSALKRLLEDASGWFKPEKLEDEIEAALRDLFSLPPLASRESPRDSDLLLDVMVPTVQRGSTLAVQFGSFPLSVFWRPKVTVAARLVHLESDQVRFACTVTQKMGWYRWLTTCLSPKGLLGLNDTVDADSMKLLLYQASIKLLKQIKKHAR